MIVSGNLTSREIDEVLESQYLGRIGMNEKGKNYVVPITYCYDKEVEGIIGVSGNGMKLRILRKNPQVCFEVEEIESLSKWRTVIGWGIFEELQGADARKAIHTFVSKVGEALKKRGEHPGQFLRDLSNSSTVASGRIVYRIVLAQKSGRFEKN